MAPMLNPHFNNTFFFAQSAPSGLLLLADLCGLLGLTKPASLGSCSSKTPCFIAGLLKYLWLTKIQFSKASLPRVTSLLPWIPAPVRTHRFLTGLSRHSWLIGILLKKALLESITHGFLFASKVVIKLAYWPLVHQISEQ